MGVPNEWLRQDGKAGSVDLSRLALPLGHSERIERISFRMTRGHWYALFPVEETKLVDGNLIEPVQLSIGGQARYGYPGELILLGATALKNWALETRKFPSSGTVSLENAVIREGDRLVMNGQTTSPIDVAWTTEHVVPPSKPHYLSETRVYATF